VLGVSDGDLVFTGAAVVVTGGALWLMHGPLLAVGFDRGSAPSLGISPLLVDTALLILLSLAILVAVQGLGNLLALAVLVAPAATAALVVKRFAPMLWLAAGLAVASGIGGLYVSYYADTAAGASIAAVTVVLYALVSMGAWAVRASRRMRGTGPAAGGREPGYARTR
jgi:ABC-type Mn2+/Zn2+ transport system permease subunit